MNILVVRVGNIGDVLMTTPFLRKLKKVFPGACVDFLTSPQAKPIVKHNEYLRHVFVFEKLKGFKRKMKRFLLSTSLKRIPYDLCFVLELHPQYKEFAQKMSAVRAVKIGFFSEGNEFLDKTLTFDYSRHVMENNFLLLKEFFGIDYSLGDFRMDFFLHPNEVQKAKRFLNKHFLSPGKYFIIHPGCSENFPYRGWEAECTARIISFLQERQYKIVLTGRESDQKLIQEILKKGHLIQRTSVQIFLDRPLVELAVLIKNAAGVLCPDTAILHIARAFNIPVAALFGPSNPQHTGAIGEGTYDCIRNDFPCGPCNYTAPYRLEDKKYCLDGRIPPCMHSITIEQVEASLEKILRSA